MTNLNSPKTSTLSKIQTRATQLSRQHWIILLRSTWHNFGEDNCTQMAAAISYFAMLSIFPLLVLTLSLFPNIIRIFSPQFNMASAVLTVVSNTVSPDASVWLSTLLPELSKNQTVINGLGIVSLLWSGSGVFNQLDSSFNRIWRLKEDARLNSGFRAAIKALLRGRFNSLWVLLLIAVIFLVNTFISNALFNIQRRGAAAIVSGQIMTFVLSFVVPILLGFISLALLYRYMAPRHVPWQAVLPGAFIIAIANEFVRLIVAYFVGGIVGAEYKGIAGPLAIMLWVFFTSQNVLFGCELTRHYYMIFYRQQRSSGTTLDS